MKQRVSILDSHTMFLQSLAHYIDTKLYDLVVVKECSTADQLLQSVKEDQLDAIIMEININQRDGVELLEDIKNVDGNIKIVVLSAYLDPLLVRKAMLRGADSFLYKGNDIMELHTALYEVSKGLTYLGANVRITPAAKKIYNSNGSLSGDAFVMKQKLTKREKEILSIITTGKNNREIGTELYISYQTVGVHRKNIMKKLGVRNTDSLIKLALDKELV